MRHRDVQGPRGVAQISLDRLRAGRDERGVAEAVGVVAPGIRVLRIVLAALDPGSVAIRARVEVAAADRVVAELPVAQLEVAL